MFAFIFWCNASQYSKISVNLSCLHPHRWEKARSSYEHCLQLPENYSLLSYSSVGIARLTDYTCPRRIFYHLRSLCFTFRWSWQFAMWKAGGRARRLSQAKNRVPHWVWWGKSSSSCPTASEIWSRTRAPVLFSHFFVSDAVWRQWQSACDGSDKQASGARWSCAAVRDVAPRAARNFHTHWLCFPLLFDLSGAFQKGFMWQCQMLRYLFVSHYQSSFLWKLILVSFVTICDVGDRIQLLSLQTRFTLLKNLLGKHGTPLGRSELSSLAKWV